MRSLIFFTLDKFIMIQKTTSLKLKIKVVLCLTAIMVICSSWGFFSHRMINRIAVFLLPEEMMGFYKKNIEYIQEAAVNPDRRRYAVKGEAARHFIDLDHYPDDGKDLPRFWNQAIELYHEDSLEAHGILPWNLAQVFFQLRSAFMVRDPAAILRLSSDLGHYVGDAQVPLHTTSNYDGQKSGQHGLHAFWESRLPELNFEDYDFLIGKATYVQDIHDRIWRDILFAHGRVDSVLHLERDLFRAYGSSKFAFESKGNVTARVVAEPYARLYHLRLRGMVENQMRRSIQLVADLWYTAWMDAGQPDLTGLIDYTPSAQEILQRKAESAQWLELNFKVRTHESGEP
jgi:hypothetical protein